MKHFYLVVQLFFLVVAHMSLYAQTYTINASGSGDCGTGGIDGPFVCVNDNATETLGSFTDTNPSNYVLDTLSLTIYDSCNGDFEVFLNGVSIATGTTSGTACACETIASTPGITNTLTVNLTPQIIDAYVMGGDNTLSVAVTNSQFGVQCFYGAEVTINTTLSTDPFNQAHYSLYPNPANTYVYVSGLQKSRPYKIINLQGQVIQEGNTSKNNAIDITQMALGLYFLQIEEGNPIRFVKQ